ncbi:hypothetical protein RB614_16050 [Phytohabitans sp. ZYX-F-186]|uniref:Uncharacterized protein n=1 Tax=Phytohabitans maris TaxID=3071409 RepID=A0ABU0ZG38_9ACTN|nr:hypothetical protein [Phytohabitans sp. ZYX-F-186]MDQ7906026.1 hypothetical protein [Phytohabitans sp. ZYX-F-186]
MPADFSVHVDPDELAAQSVAAAFPHGDAEEGRKAGRSAKPAAAARRGKASRGGQSAAQPRRYAFRRS